MGRSRRNKPLLERVVISDIAAEGKALGKVNDTVVFVPLAAPGDVVDVQVTKKRKRYYEGRPVRFHHLSDIRTEPFCRHFGICGGCKWQHIPYNEQLKFKQREVWNNLKRIGKVELPEISPILPSPEERFYRNKLEFTFSNRRWLSPEEMESDEIISNKNGLGFHIPGMFDKVIDIEECHLQRTPSNEVRLAVRNFALENNWPFFDLKTQEGFLRTLIIRTSSTGEAMVIIVFYHDDKKKREQLFEHLIKKFPDVTSWMYVINEKANDTITDLKVHLFSGRDHIFEEMEGLKFKIGPKSFYQTNSLQAYNLYKVARSFAGLTGNETVYDLYTGTGTIANFIAHNARKVIGIEYVPEAIENAEENSELNGISNTRFLAGDMKDILTYDLFEKEGFPDVLITDPPRAGMHEDVVRTILNAAPEKVVYVSCNSATQARDINLLDARYKVSALQPVDMFPHTHHVENIALLERK
ncbi:MAG: rRNA ((1939)-C(5))-methyltransferase RlmD [Anaerophaga sp.]|uniref:23S rRNA (uracil(1939)-C(5))-methyltransferase RlmD n=1 Tax=Anaerophaga thermohalophila TaxID=177400 RepID=UPI000237C41A|nr:23S rRNA (uracil(1939)-C(5))-methyltransferase RlmD [Anaerophaga thermohalophila]MBZ4676121.1 rRNA ((1939)-C(5))-methyltransferase RlmD [Anaerophaga sp.]